MKKIIILISTLIFAINSFSQQIFVSSSKIYLETVNPIKICVEGLNCNDIYVKSDNAKIEGSNCQYLIFPKTQSLTTIYIYKINGKDTIELGKREFYAEPLPNPIAYAGGKHSGFISKDELSSWGLIKASIEFADGTIWAKVLKYTIKIKRNDNVIFTKNIIGISVPIEIQEKIKTCLKYDEVIFENIETEIIYQKNYPIKRTVNPINLIIEK